jgi:hypothetical protein
VLRRRSVGIATAALATVLAAATAGVAVRDRGDRDQVAVDPSAGSTPLPLVSDLGPIVGAQLLDATTGCALTGDRLAWTAAAAGWSPPTSRTTAARSS